MKEGMPIKEALREAGLVRLRPIVMTTLAMIFGMIPAAVATGAGSEIACTNGTGNNWWINYIYNLNIICSTNCIYNT